MTCTLFSQSDLVDSVKEDTLIKYIHHAYTLRIVGL